MTCAGRGSGMSAEEMLAASGGLCMVQGVFKDGVMGCIHSRPISVSASAPTVLASADDCPEPDGDTAVQRGLCRTPLGEHAVAPCRCAGPPRYSAGRPLHCLSRCADVHACLRLPRPTPTV